MLTRLAIKGFKNLTDVEVRFGPVTYVAGPNGVGKSNVFDAIHFLSQLADKPFIEAAKGVRGGGEPHHLFSAGGRDRIEFDCDVLIPLTGIDDFGQPAQASCTYLNYQLVLRYEEQAGIPKIRLECEALTAIEKHAVEQQLAFPTSDAWRQSVIRASPQFTEFIATDDDGHVRLLAERQGDAKNPRGSTSSEFSAKRLPRTLLSSMQNAEEHRTAVLLRQEMLRWRKLQLEPSELRAADDLQSPQSISISGSHVPATLYRLASSSNDAADVYEGVTNRVAELVAGVDGIRVERDDGRRLFTLLLRDRHGVELPASSLSDGTLRFVALAVMEADPDATGVVCLEELENGIHPRRVEAMLRLISDMAVDPMEPVDADNPLRQVIVSTHSPLVVANADLQDVLFASSVSHSIDSRVVQGLRLRGIEGSWRQAAGQECVAIGNVLAYLDLSGTPLADEASTRVRDLVRRAQHSSSRRISWVAGEG